MENQLAPPEGGDRRQPSTVRGWLRKWGGTLSSNEELRRRVSFLSYVSDNKHRLTRNMLQGMREMRRASEHRRVHKMDDGGKARRTRKQRKSTSYGILSFLSRKRTPNHRQFTRLPNEPRTPPQAKPRDSPCRAQSRFLPGTQSWVPPPVSEPDLQRWAESKALPPIPLDPKPRIHNRLSLLFGRLSLSTSTIALSSSESLLT